MNFDRHPDAGSPFFEMASALTPSRIEAYDPQSSAPD
jgi:hypothetical protein